MSFGGAPLRIVDVDDLSNYIRDLFDADPFLDDIWVRGEVSNARQSPAGHHYFTLKSASSQLRCVLFRGNAELIAYQPRNGEAVLAHGRVSSYPAFGEYQLYVDQVLPEGAGLLQVQFEQLRQKLENEGLFDTQRKRTLPEYPTHIGVVTSATGSVWHDIQNVLRRRYPLAELILSSAIVQGEAAPDSIVAALQRLVADGRAEVAIVGRGGGSIEDLWAFNDERVVRAIFRCPIPVVAAIGHETDITLADLVADVRAPTPSAAAEIVAPHIREYRQHLAAMASGLAGLIATRLNAERYNLNQYLQRVSRHNPHWKLEQERLRVDRLGERSERHMALLINQNRTQVAGYERQLSLLNPRHLFGRGFALVTDATTGNRVRGASELTPGQSIELGMKDGVARASVESIQEHGAETFDDD